MSIFSKAFWQYAGERAIKTAAQTAIAVLGTSSAGLFSMDLAGFASAVSGATLLSLLTSILAYKPTE